MVDLEEMMLQEEVGENEEGIGIEDGDNREENVDEDGVEMSVTSFRGLKRARVD